jgi:hypothetical protein
MNILERGDSGDLVAQLQQNLIEQGYDVGEDAHSKFFGRDTYNAVCMFQGGHLDKDGVPLKVDGQVGEKTEWALANPSGVKQTQTIEALPANQRPANSRGEIILAAAMSEYRKDVKEEPDGSNRSERIDLYTGFVGKPKDRVGPPWCAYFVSFCAAAIPGGSPFGRIGNAQNLGLWGDKHKCSLIPGVAQAKPGDIFVIARDDVHGHCGIVQAALAQSIWTIEGNCGNRVDVRQRKLSTITKLVRLPG